MPLPADHLYADPHVYDVLHDAGTKRDVRMFASLAARHGALPQRRAVWLEPASGSGRYLLEVARRGDRAIGFDINPAMIRYALARARSLRLAQRVRCHVASMEDFAAELALQPQSVHVAFNPINSIRHLGSDRAMLMHLRSMKHVLAPTGVYIVGISLVAYRWEQPTEDVWKARRDGLRVTQVVQYVPAAWRSRGVWKRRERVISHLTITHAKEQIDRTSTYWLRCYSKSQWHAIIARAGFAIVGTADTEGNPHAPADSGYALYVLRPASR